MSTAPFGGASFLWLDEIDSSIERIIEECIAEVADALDDLLIGEPRMPVHVAVSTCVHLAGDINRIVHNYDLSPRQRRVVDDLKREVLNLALDLVQRPVEEVSEADGAAADAHVSGGSA